MSEAIDSGKPVCAPVVEWGWSFKNNCFALNPEIGWIQKFRFKSLALDGERSVISVNPPSTTYNNLISIIVWAKPLASQLVLINATLCLKMQDGSTKYLVGTRQMSGNGGVLTLTTKGTIPINQIQSAILKFDIPVELAFSLNKPNNPAVMWIGN